MLTLTCNTPEELRAWLDALAPARSITYAPTYGGRDQVSTVLLAQQTVDGGPPYADLGARPPGSIVLAGNENLMSPTEPVADQTTGPIDAAPETVTEEKPKARRGRPPKQPEMVAEAEPEAVEAEPEAPAEPVSPPPPPPPPPAEAPAAAEPAPASRDALKKLMNDLLNDASMPNDIQLRLKGIFQKHGSTTGGLGGVPEENLPGVAADMQALRGQA